MKRIFLVMAVAIFATSCTDNNRAKNFGGNMTVNLPKGQKLVTVTWKEGSLWYLTRPMEANEQPVESRFQEKSAHGFVEGAVIIKESK
jgi:hypothetical protein